MQRMRIPFDSILRFEAVKIPIGHDCVSPPIDSDLLDEPKTESTSLPFEPIMVRLLIKDPTRRDFISIHDLGATPLPILIPLLRNLAPERMSTAHVVLNSADDCRELAKRTIGWVRDVNSAIEGEVITPHEVTTPNERTRDASALYQANYSAAPAPDYVTLTKIYGQLGQYDSLDVKQTLVSAQAALLVSILLHDHRRKKKMSAMARAARLKHSFPISLLPSENHAGHLLGVDELYETCRQYHERNDRPISEAFDAIAEHVSDLVKRRVILDSSSDLSFIEDNAPRPFNFTDSTMMMSEKGRVLSGIELRHETQLIEFLAKEDIAVHYLEGLPFLSLLVGYETEDGDEHFAVVIKEGIHQALKEFLLAHEMGHWFLHVNDRARNTQVARYLRSSGRGTFLEKEADNFGMTVLFPPAYLADWVILKKGELSVDALLDEFTCAMTQEIRPTLRGEMRRYIGDLIEKYEAFKKDKEPSFFQIEVASIEEENLKGLLDLVYQAKDTVYWVRLSHDSSIIDASNDCENLFGKSKDEIKGTTPLELVIPEERERMRLRAEYRMQNKKAIYYFTEVWNKKQNTSHPVVVYSFPILKSGEYVGAMAALRLLDPRD
jgi:PAS domain S-box-containing protein